MLLRDALLRPSRNAKTCVDFIAQEPGDGVARIQTLRSATRLQSSASSRFVSSLMPQQFFQLSSQFVQQHAVATVVEMAVIVEEFESRQTIGGGDGNGSMDVSQGRTSLL